MQQANCINRRTIPRKVEEIRRSRDGWRSQNVTETDRKLCKPVLELKLTRQARLHRDRDVPMMHYP